MKRTIFRYLVALAVIASSSLFSGRSARAQAITLDPTQVVQNVLQTIQDADMAGWLGDISSLLKDKEEYENLIETLKGITVATAYIRVLVTTLNVAINVYSDIEEYRDVIQWFDQTGQWYQVVSARAVWSAYQQSVKDIMEYTKSRTSLFNAQEVKLQKDRDMAIVDPNTGKVLNGLSQTAFGRESAINSAQYAEDLIRNIYSYLDEAKRKADYSFYVLYMDVVRLENSLANAKLVDILYY